MLDDQDDGVLFSLKITPISMRYYTFFKLLVSFIFSVIGTIVLLFITNITQLTSFSHILMITLLASLQAPFIALVMASFSKNKVEGFVIMKLTGLTLIGPIMALFLTDWTEFLLGIFPGFWPSRMILMEITTISYTLSSPYLYFLLGFMVHIIIMVSFFKLYSKKYLS
jgi:fluoroquinolone transport system permease protein